MNKAREELLQALTEKLGCVWRGIHTGQGFPFGELKIGVPQVRILFYIARNKDGVSVKDVAEMLNVTSGAVTQFIDGLVEKALVTREEDANDRRILRIKLAGLAERRFKRFSRDYFASVSRIFDTLSDAEIEQLIRLLGKINIPTGAKECK